MHNTVCLTFLFISRGNCNLAGLGYIAYLSIMK